MRHLSFTGLVFSVLLTLAAPASASENTTWMIGSARAKITPHELLWMAGFSARTKPAEGTLDDLWVKALALEAADGGRVLLVTADLVGIPKWLYDDLCHELERRQDLKRGQIRFAYSHTHSGPVLKDALQDIYPLDDRQRALSAQYSQWLRKTILETADKALAVKAPATLWAGDGRATFAMNRRTNDESKLAEMRRKGQSPRGPSDFAVPVLAVRSPEGKLLAVVCGYAAHTSVLIPNNYRWSADYAGVTQRALEARYPQAAAMFFQGCGSDQSAVPRGTVETCQARGRDLAAAVEAVLEKPMRPLTARLRSAFAFVSLDFGAQPTKTELERLDKSTDYRARWARRLSAELTAGNAFPRGYPEYPVQVWRLGGRPGTTGGLSQFRAPGEAGSDENGTVPLAKVKVVAGRPLGDDQLWIALGGEVCVDYALRFKHEYGEKTWVTGYANDVMAYIPSRRLWQEGGYQAGAFDVYGLPATRWCPDIEDRIAATVARLIKGSN
jgi:neutral ceramidase